MISFITKHFLEFIRHKFFTETQTVMSKLQQKKKEFLGFKDVHAEKEKSVK